MLKSIFYSKKITKLKYPSNLIYRDFAFIHGTKSIQNCSNSKNLIRLIDYGNNYLRYKINKILNNFLQLLYQITIFFPAK